MAQVKTSITRKLKKLLAARFPPPSTVRLEEREGIIGLIISSEFLGMEPMDRQDLIARILEEHFSRDERRQVQLIVAVTPDEETGYLAGLD